MLGVVAIVMVATLVIHMWRTGPKIQQKMRDTPVSGVSRGVRVLRPLPGVFLFTFLMITREGMETALVVDAGSRIRNSLMARCSVCSLQPLLPGAGLVSVI